MYAGYEHITPVSKAALNINSMLGANATHRKLAEQTLVVCSVQPTIASAGCEQLTPLHKMRSYRPTLLIGNLQSRSSLDSRCSGLHGLYLTSADGCRLWILNTSSQARLIYAISRKPVACNRWLRVSKFWLIPSYGGSLLGPTNCWKLAWLAKVVWTGLNITWRGPSCLR